MAEGGGEEQGWKRTVKVNVTMEEGKDVTWTYVHPMSSWREGREYAEVLYSKTLVLTQHGAGLMGMECWPVSRAGG